MNGDMDRNNSRISQISCLSDDSAIVNHGSVTFQSIGGSGVDSSDSECGSLEPDEDYFDDTSTNGTRLLLCEMFISI